MDRLLTLAAQVTTETVVVPPSETVSILSFSSWPALAAFLTIISMLIGIGITMGILQARSVRNAEAAAEAKATSQTAMQNSNEAMKALAKFREEVAGKYVTNQITDKIEGRIADEVSKIEAAINRLSDRIDRMNEINVRNFSFPKRGPNT